jgi:hypothetical protein
MAGWGTGSFENEGAQNWLKQLKSLGLDELRRLLVHGADDAEYLEENDASIVVAAAEVIAALRGAPAQNLPREIADWVSVAPGSPPSDLRDVAIRAVEKVRRSSELKDLWMEAEGLNEWTAALGDLQARLSS